jgi:O-antigen/teichoic acid export membrane protein
VALLEFVVLRLSVRRILAFGPSRREPWSFAPLRRVAGFSLRVAFASLVWVLVTQLDKLLLSSLLPLSDYGWFSLAVTAAGGISLLAAPIGQAVQPRLTYLFAEGSDATFRATYADATQLLSAIALTSSFILAVGARPLLWAWTGDAILAERAAPVLALYSLGNGLLSIVAMTYYLQVARGDLSLHLKGNVVFAALLVPTIVMATARGGMLGAGLAWCGANLAFFLAWTAIVHKKFLPGLHARWFVLDAALPCMAGLLPIVALSFIRWGALSRFETALALGAGGASAVGLALLATRPGRRSVLQFQRLVASRGVAR